MDSPSSEEARDKVGGCGGRVVRRPCLPNSDDCSAAAAGWAFFRCYLSTAGAPSPTRPPLRCYRCSFALATSLYAVTALPVWLPPYKPLARSAVSWTRCPCRCVRTLCISCRPLRCTPRVVRPPLFVPATEVSMSARTRAFLFAALSVCGAYTVEASARCWLSFSRCRRIRVCLFL